jgi:hypothetical protein
MLPTELYLWIKEQSYKAGISMSKFIKNGTKVEDEKCPICNKSTIVYQESCKMCISCGWSKC